MALFLLENHEPMADFELNSHTALLLSQLLDEESHVEDCDDERLTSVIRSLEAEIIEPNMMIEDYDCSFMELEWDDNYVEIDNYVSNGLQEDVIRGDSSTPSDFDDLHNYNLMNLEEKIEFGGLGDDYYHSFS
ncbi:hypothetical protein AgCh_005902 [Apium graveolens]